MRSERYRMRGGGPAAADGTRGAQASGRAVCCAPRSSSPATGAKTGSLTWCLSSVCSAFWQCARHRFTFSAGSWHGVACCSLCMSTSARDGMRAASQAASANAAWANSIAVRAASAAVCLWRLRITEGDYLISFDMLASMSAGASCGLTHIKAAQEAAHAAPARREQRGSHPLCEARLHVGRNGLEIIKVP